MSLDCLNIPLRVCLVVVLDPQIHINANSGLAIRLDTGTSILAASPSRRQPLLSLRASPSGLD